MAVPPAIGLADARAQKGDTASAVDLLIRLRPAIADSTQLAEVDIRLARLRIHK